MSETCIQKHAPRDPLRLWESVYPVPKRIEEEQEASTAPFLAEEGEEAIDHGTTPATSSSRQPQGSDEKTKSKGSDWGRDSIDWERAREAQNLSKKSNIEARLNVAQTQAENGKYVQPKPENPK